jgi:hypothetical protein
MGPINFTHRTAVLAILACGLAACVQPADSLSGAAVQPQAAGTSTAPADPAQPAGASQPTGQPVATSAPAASQLENPWQQLLDAAPPGGDQADTVGASTDSASSDALAGGAKPAGFPSTGTPSACQAMLKPLADAAKAGDKVEVSLTTVMGDGRYSSRGTSTTEYQLKSAGSGQPFRAVLDTQMFQYFSDRTFDRFYVPPGNTKCTLPCTIPQAYDAARPDRLGLSTEVSTGNTTLTLVSWGNSTVKLTPSCDQGLLWGYGGGMLYAITVRNLTTHLPVGPGPVVP